MHKIDQRIIELAQNGNKVKAIAEVVKKEGIKTAKGKTPNYFYVRNKLQSLKAKGAFNISTPNSNGQTKSSIPALQSILTDEAISDARKVAILKAWFC